MNNEKITLTSREAAKYLCVSLSKLFKMCHFQEIPYYKVGRLNVFRLTDLEKYLDSKRVPVLDKSSADLKINFSNKKS